jgi:uncharacterized protein (DUF362 family)
MSTVAIVESDNKIDALDTVIEKTSFLQDVAACCSQSTKSKKEFSIVIKPNIMMFYSRKNPHVATDPELVEHLVKRIREEGYSTITLVESRNIYTNWFPKRTVHYVAEVAGYTFQGYELVDLTEEEEPYDYGGVLQEDTVGKTWKDADYRISFQKSKTHMVCSYTLTMKNLFGTLPHQSKFKKYHEGIGMEQATIDVIRNFPPDFAFIDAFWCSHGMNGAVLETPIYTQTVMGGKDFVAVDWVGASKMGVDPMGNPLMKMAVDLYGKPEYEVDGSLEQYKNWKNSTVTLGKTLMLFEGIGVSSSIYHFIFNRVMDSAFR